MQIRAACDELAAQKLHALTPGEPPITLEAFLARHRAHAESVLRMLHSFSRGAVHTTQVGKCQEVALALKESARTLHALVTQPCQSEIALALKESTRT